MYDKLLKLMLACIEDEKMILRKDNSLLSNFGIYLSNQTVLKTAVLNSFYKGRYIRYNDSINSDVDSLKEYEERNRIEFRFKYDPSIIIWTENIELPNRNVKFKGIKDTWLTKKEVEIDVQLIHVKLIYKLTCGSFNFDIDDATVTSLVNKINENFNKFKQAAEEKEINNRLTKYGIAID